MQGLFSFPGLPPTVVQSATYSLGHGISPGVITVDVPAGTALPKVEGTAVFSFGSTEIELPGCRVDVGTLRINQGQMWTFGIQDWRWRLAFGDISGHYNLRKPDGSLRTETERSPRSLATELLNRCKVRGFDVSKMPDVARPEIHWSWANPAQALSALCDAVGCRVVCQRDMRIEIWPAGIGAELPDGPTSSIDLGLDPKAVPSGILVVGGPSLWQMRWNLEAVGRDVDGKVKPIDDLSYKPSAGWEAEFPGRFSSVRENNAKDQADPRRLALQTVFRWYRIKDLVGGPKVPGVDFDVDDIKLVLPLEDGLVETFPVTTEGIQRRRPPIVRGTWTDDEFLFEDQENKQYKGEFDVNGPAGIVVFGRPVYKLDAGAFKPAEFTLEIAFPIKNPDTLEPERETWRFPIEDRSDVGDLVQRADDLILSRRAKYDDDGNPTDVVGNRDTDKLDEQAEDIGRTIAGGFTSTAGGERVYAGLFPFRLDGAIQQITWNVGRGPAYTRVSRNSEHDADIVPPFRDRQRLVQLKTLLSAGEQKKKVEA